MESVGEGGGGWVVGWVEGASLWKETYEGTYLQRGLLRAVIVHIPSF